MKSDTRATTTGSLQNKSSLTKAAVLYQPNEPLRIEELSCPELAEGQVLVKVSFSGICHSQLLEIRGKRGVDRYLPHTLGHEGSGIVQAVGPRVTRVTPGDSVILSWIKGPGINAAPPTYRTGKQTINGGPLTTFQEYTVASENRLTPIPKEIPRDKAALIGCAVATGAGAILNTAKLERGQTVAIFGAGGIGLCAVQAARIMNASKIIAVDLHEEKLRQAQKFGATHTVNARKEDPIKKIQDLTEGKGVDTAIEAAGLSETMENAFHSVRRGGGLAILIGNLPQGMQISIDPFDLICGKRIVGSWGGETRPERDFLRYLDFYQTGKLKLDELISHRFRLEEINEAFDALENGEVSRALVAFE